MWVLFDLFHLHHAHCLHHHNGVGVDRCDRPDELQLITRQGEGEAIRFFSAGILVGSDKDEGYISGGHFHQRLPVNSLRLRLTVDKVKILRTCYTQSVHLYRQGDTSSEGAGTFRTLNPL